MREKFFRYRMEVQVLLENLLPLIGLFLLDWGVAIVFFYFFLDLLINVILHVVKKHRILDEQRKLKLKKRTARAPFTVRFILLQLLFLIFSLSAMIWISETVLLKEGHVREGIVSFFSLVMDEVWIIPFVALAAYLNYKMEFIRQMHYRMLLAKGYYMRQIIRSIPVVGLLMILSMISYYLPKESFSCLAFFIGFKAIYDLWLVKDFKDQLKIEI